MANHLSPRPSNRMLLTRTKRIPPFPCRVEGWLNICDKEVALGHHPSNKLTAKNGDKAPLVSWEPYFCVLLQDEQTFTAYRSEEMAVCPGFVIKRSRPQMGDMVFSDTPRVRLDSGGRQFRRRWGYDGSAGGCGGGAGPASLNGGAGHLEDIEEDGDDISDTYSLRDETLYNSILHEGDDSGEVEQCRRPAYFFQIYFSTLWDR
ncbi:hypothetical protein GHT06_021378 [Daphnia sinensis]|uniref:Uncharacterized protein n=1 Tax=Daphnia sinensis TaxID=1820382 RepID=A0AAD5PPU2_9CRUS|nr:hypothetical protein GHT06_021378 [Daphnia sinensis]